MKVKKKRKRMTERRMRIQFRQKASASCLPLKRCTALFNIGDALGASVMYETQITARNCGEGHQPHKFVCKTSMKGETNLAIRNITGAGPTRKRL